MREMTQEGARWHVQCSDLAGERDYAFLVADAPDRSAALRQILETFPARRNDLAR